MRDIEYKKYIPKRVIATIIDYTVVFALTFFYIFTFGTQSEEGTYTVTGLPALVPFFFWIIYFIVCEAFVGGSLGHQLLGLKVISVNGKPLTIGQAILRRISDALEITWCFGLIAFILVKNNPQAQRLGDMWAKTIVIGKDDVYSNLEFEFEKQ